MKTSHSSPAVAALLAFAVGCASPAPAAHDGHAPTAAPDPTSAAPAAASPITADRPYTDGDVRFMQSMIPHHRQALVMTELVEERTDSRDIRLIAERIAVSQRDEIARMARWLSDRGEEVPEDHGAGHGGEAHGGEHGGMDHAGMQHDAETHARHMAEAASHASMPGMLSAAELESLRAASGAEFDRLFLDLMIRHHEGALVMVEELFASPSSGQEPEIFQLAADVDADQRMEIDRMYQLRRSLD